MLLPDNTQLQGGKYKIVRHISSGGFGNTYEGIHTIMDTRVAIKEFFVKSFCNRDETSGSMTVASQANAKTVEKLKEKFMKEAKAIFGMSHKNIVRVTDIFLENDTVYYVMDYIDGCSLNDILKQKGKFPEAEALGYIRQVADALKYVHARNRLHLDIKPGNIMLTKDGIVKLIDFGASKHYDEETGENTSTLLGIYSNGYAPVEQAVKGFTSFSPATDIYALGATFYKLITGITPPEANHLVFEPDALKPLPQNISVFTRNAIEAAMQLQYKNRPQTIVDFLDILDGATDLYSTKVEEKEENSKNRVIVEIDETPKNPKNNTKSSKNHNSRRTRIKIYQWLKRGIISIVVIAFIAILAIVLTPIVELEMIRHSAERGNVEAIEKLANAYACGKYGLKEDSITAIEWYTKAAEMGYAEIQYKLGNIYANGEGIEQDSTKAIEWYTKAADCGNTDGQYILAIYYYEGKWVKQNYAKAVELFQNVAAKWDNSSAQFYLGFCYANGYGVEQDSTLAIEWYRKAVKNGDSGAMNNLGFCYQYGKGVHQNMAKAVELYKMAADKGEIIAQRNLGLCYENGEGVEQDTEKAIEWYKKAADQGDEPAKSNLIRLGVPGYY